MSIILIYFHICILLSKEIQIESIFKNTVNKNSNKYSLESNKKNKFELFELEINKWFNKILIVSLLIEFIFRITVDLPNMLLRFVFV